ncbi:MULTISPECIES: hypothetical protein [unclassified Curtobacterium]|uniref:hypothetical protein n=1 Tax=unclassified Curtobacterium TaxID=257496 RepID=UPI003A811B8B
MRLHRRLALVLTATLVATAAAVVAPVTTAQAAAPTTGRYTPITTTRVWSGSLTTTPKVVPIAGLAGVPANATAVVVNVEVKSPTAAGYLRVTPAGRDATVATQDFAAGQTIANLVTVRLAGGKIQAKLSRGSANGYFDVAGYYADGSGATYTPLNASRVFGGTVGTSPTKVPLAGKGGVPSNATAVVVNTQVSGPSAAGYVRVTPAGQDPGVVTQLFGAGQSLSNLAIVKLVNGAVQVKLSKGSATVYLDVAGYYSASTTGSVFVPIDTTRAYGGTITSTTRTVRLTGTAGVPGTATAVVANAEVTGPTSAAYLRVTPAGADAQVATQLFTPGRSVANLVMSKVTGSSVDRRVQVKASTGSAVLHLDVAGYFLDGSSGSGFGADVSWPQGGSSSNYPSNQAFGVVGVNGSLPNQTNQYLSQQLAWAAGSTGGTSQPKGQLYVLAANPGKQASVWPSSNRDPSGATVANPYGTCTAGSYTSACSYMYGYTRAYEAANTRGVPSPSSYRWWIDVETGLSWLGATDAKDYQIQNRADVEGMVAALKAAKISTIGLYSTKYQFGQIVGTVPSTSTLRGLPSWIAVGNDGVAAAQAACSAGGLTAGSQVRMTQYVVGSRDFDVSCV